MENIQSTLQSKIANHSANVGVIGLGYVGLPMCIEFAKAGYNVTGIDKDANRIAQLKENRSYILDVDQTTLRSVSGKLHPTTDFQALSSVDVAIICVPTPLRKTKDPDLSFILSATNEVAKYLHAGQLIILESTTYPGTTDEVILPELQQKGLRVG